MRFDDGLSAVISVVMRSSAVDYPTARTIVHALNNSGYLTHGGHMKRTIWRGVERALCWYVFMHCPDGGVAPIIGFWRKRDAKRWIDGHTPQYRLEVHRYGWNLT